MLSKKFYSGQLGTARRMWLECCTSDEIVYNDMLVKGHVYKDHRWQEIPLTRVRAFGPLYNDLIIHTGEVISLGHGTLTIRFRTRLGTCSE